MSRARCAGVLFCWKVNMFPETRRSTPDFLAPNMWPPNSPDLNPVDYAIWSIMQQRVYQTNRRAATASYHRVMWTGTARYG